uniref:Putative secreted protein n=1 Tax=Anopheles darlingi TaxID=43151 RepID=A0A2M4DA94_ANODA
MRLLVAMLFPVFFFGGTTKRECVFSHKRHRRNHCLGRTMGTKRSFPSLCVETPPFSEALSIADLVQPQVFRPHLLTSIRAAIARARAAVRHVCTTESRCHIIGSLGFARKSLLEDCTNFFGFVKTNR